jgi:ATPase subunit of ABC transporter with duplicated ATPase domains
MTDPPDIDVRRLSKTFGDTVAVDGLSFTAEPGRLTCFLGPNGAGKTTTLRMVLGLVEPTAGTATIAGRSLMSRTALVRDDHGDWLILVCMANQAGYRFGRGCRATRPALTQTAVRSSVGQHATGRGAQIEHRLFRWLLRPVNTDLRHGGPPAVRLRRSERRLGGAGWRCRRAVARRCRRRR